jgi:hypothetical protein
VIHYHDGGGRPPGLFDEATEQNLNVSRWPHWSCAFGTGALQNRERAMCARREYALLALYIKGGKTVWDDVETYIGEEELFASIINGTEVPKVCGDRNTSISIEVSHELHVFPTEGARADALRLGRGMIIWLRNDDEQASAHIRILTAAELAVYRVNHKQ